MARLGCFWLLLFCAACQAQQDTPAAAPDGSAPSASAPITTLRVTSRVVEISAVVKDKHGEPQAGLTRDDFVLKQDGREEPIRYFSIASDLPLTVALLVDVSGSQRTFISDEWRASDVFFQTMLTRPQDRAMLVQIDARVRQLMGMTNSITNLHLALTQLGASSNDSGKTLLNDSVYFIARDFLAKEKGRKAIILLTDGGENGSRASLEQAIGEAQRANVPVYAVLYSAWAGPELGAGTAMRFAGDPGEAILKKLAENTGGHVYAVSGGLPLRKIYEQIGEELRTQYELGYSLPPDLKPNSFHKLEVKTKDKKLAVQARSGFFAQP